MSRIDRELILRKIKLIEEDLDKLRVYENISFEKYLKSFEIRLVVERLLEKITGRLIDVNYHILREEYEIMPEDYYNSFIEIGKNKIITEEFAESMAKSVGLRNALAHEYEKIDQALIYGSIKVALVQVPDYIKKILEFTEK